MNKEVYYLLEETDVVLFMVDVLEKIVKEGKFILEKYGVSRRRKWKKKYIIIC